MATKTTTIEAEKLQTHMEKLPYWLVNTDLRRTSPECPDFLRDVSDKDRKQLATPDHQYQRLSWADVNDIVASKQIERFRRLPSDLRKYREYTYKLKQRYGSIMSYMIEQRLKWPDLVPRNVIPFAEPEDYTILFNDFPYGLQTDIVHLVVWVKFKFTVDDEGELTPDMQQLCERFMSKTFYPHVPPEKTLWFRNPPHLKSVHAVEHIHVVLKGADPNFLQQVTRGDVAMIDKVETLDTA